MFFEKGLRRYGWCKRLPPANGMDFRVLKGLLQIHWVVSKGRTEFADEEAAEDFDPEKTPDPMEWPITEEAEWCGEFKAEWPNPHGLSFSGETNST